MSAQLIIRPLHRDDEAEWRRLWAAYLAFYGTTREDNVYASTFARLLGEAPYDPSALIAELNGTPVGLVHYLLHRHCWRVEDVCYLQDLYADPEVRGSGVGRALIEGVYAAADALGTPAVYWTTQQGNAVGRRLYDRIGEVTDFIKYQRPAV